jgi:hypothetical protein
MRLQQRGFDAAALRNAVARVEMIEAYPDDKYLPSFPSHAQIATDIEGNNGRVVTMYTPDQDEWDERFRKRRKR